jgi:magnesium-transporting ATPase (P-type)
VSLKNFLHRGTHLKNSGSVLALVIYCGKDSKIIQNQGRYKFKKSSIEFGVDLIILFNCLWILSVAAIMAGRNYQFVDENGENYSYLWPHKKKFTKPDPFKSFSKAYASFYLILNRIVPLSIMITLEVFKITYTVFIEADATMMG